MLSAINEGVKCIALECVGSKMEDIPIGWRLTEKYCMLVSLNSSVFIINVRYTHIVYYALELIFFQPKKSKSTSSHIKYLTMSLTIIKNKKKYIKIYINIYLCILATSFHLNIFG